MFGLKCVLPLGEKVFGLRILNLLEQVLNGPPADGNAFNDVTDEGMDKLDHMDETYEIEENSETRSFILFRVGSGRPNRPGSICPANEY